ncbi:hypothetical protein FRB90_000905 [Tulasnella sp. 427]|nr:hypothetical protein FRB90_000905 [Tulasnella sp. 427]
MTLEPPPRPTNDDLEDLLLSCRYGDIDDVKLFVTEFDKEAVATVRDGNGNTVLHMTCGNGHLELLDYLLTIVPASLLSVSNNAKSTPLHWATTNKQLPIVQRLIEYPGGPGSALIDQKNQAGLTAIGEAEMQEWEEGAKWLVEKMTLDGDGGKEETGVEELPEGDAEGTEA